MKPFLLREGVTIVRGSIGLTPAIILTERAHVRDGFNFLQRGDCAIRFHTVEAAKALHEELDALIRNWGRAEGNEVA